MTFKIGDQVIYPNQGVGVVEEITKRSIAGRQEEFYVLRILANQSIVMIPVNNVKQVGLRRICDEKQLDRLFEILKNHNAELDPDWKNRYKDNIEKMKSGSIFEVAEVLKNLYFLNFQKTLSFREKKMFDRARQLIISEIATVREESPEDVETSVEKILTQAYERSHVQPA